MVNRDCSEYQLPALLYVDAMLCQVGTHVKKGLPTDLRCARGERQLWAEAVWKLGSQSLLRRNFSPLADIGSYWSFGAVSMRQKAWEQTWRASPWITASICPDYPGIAAISPLIPTKATMRLML